MNHHRLLQNAVILDTETTGLGRGSGIHELAVLDLDRQHLHEMLLKPNMVSIGSNPAQELTRLSSSPLDKHRGYYPERWTDVMAAQASMDLKKQVKWKAARRALAQTNPFLARALDNNTHPHLLGNVPGPADLRAREKVLKDIGGVRSAVSEYTSIQEVLRPGGKLERELRGKTIWIANAAFESKQLGAQIGAMQAQGVDSNIKSMLETQNPSSVDPFYVTGKDVNKARTMAQRSGDWTGVWRAMLANPPGQGEAAVRDIQDVTRAFMSYGKQLGLSDLPTKSYSGTGIDLTYRLFGSLEDNKSTARSMLGFAEVHRASEDVAISERYVLEQATKYTDVLQQVSERTALGNRYIEQARGGGGPLQRAADYFARLGAIAPEMQRQAVIKRLGRAREDIAGQGATYQVQGIERTAWMKQQRFGGGETSIPRNIYDRVRMESVEEVVNFLEDSGQYQGVDVQTIHRQMTEATAGQGIGGVKRFVQAQAPGVGDYVASRADELMATTGTGLNRLLSSTSRSGQAAQMAADVLKQVRVGSSARAFGTVAAGIAGLGFTASWSGIDSHKAQEAPSITAFSYEQWLAQQQEFSGSQGRTMDGMNHGGWAGDNRRFNTDFGSPYQGPISSGQILYDQQLLQERERWLREQYGARHYDPEHGVHGMFGPFQRYKLGPSRYKTFIGAGTDVAGKYKGLRGKSLQGINLSEGNWKIDVDDADTITVKRGGIRGAVTDFFGMNRSYSFRLAGIDSTETHHGSTSYHAPQPHAEAAAAALRSMVAGSKNLELVFDPTQMTYGRMMGAVIADGKNLNFELVKRGHAAHLPFGSKYKSMIDYDALKKAETQAYQSQRGMWAHPWSQAFYEFSEASGNRLTLNTLTKKSRIVENVDTMDALSLMEQAQAQGQFTTADAVAAAAIGQGYKTGADRVRPVLLDQDHRPHNNHMDEMKRDLSQFMTTTGTGGKQNRFSRRGGYGKLDGYMALDTMGRTNSVWSRRQLQQFQNYGSGQAITNRRAAMAAAQRQANQQMFRSPIGHHQM